LEDWFQCGRLFSHLSRDLLTEIFRYWGHEHDYRNNLTCVRRGGVVPRQFPCNRKEVESLRDGPFSGFRASSEAFLEKGASGKSSRKDKRVNKSLSEDEIEVLEWQEAQAKQASVAAGPREEGPPVADQDAEGAEDELNETHSVAEGDELAEAEDDDSVYVLGEEDDGSEPSQWESDILCVVDPFIRAKVKASYVLMGWWGAHLLTCCFESQNLAGPIRPPVLARFREDCQRVVLRLRLGGNLDALLRFDPRTRPPSPPPQPNQRRRQRPQGGERGGNRGRGRGGPSRGHTRGGAPKTPGEAQAT